MYKLLTILIVGAALAVTSLSACTHASAQAQRTYGLGHAAEPAQIARLDIDVAPDGSGLPEGRGDAVDGAAIFAASCQRCHGAAIRLDPERWPYATTLFDYVRRAMPPNRNAEFSADDLYALTAYELNMNGILLQHEIVSKATLPLVKMPGIEHFVKQP